MGSDLPLLIAKVSERSLMRRVIWIAFAKWRELAAEHGAIRRFVDELVNMSRPTG